MAATPKRAAATEAALAGVRLRDKAGHREATKALESDFEPIDDMRASADYRMQTAKALLVKALHEASGAQTLDTRIVGVRDGELEPAT